MTANFMSIEMSEHRYPLEFDEFAMREDSGGAGRHRGGCGTQYKIRALADCVISALGDRVDHAPFGIAGGGPAARSEVRLTVDGREFTPPMRSKFEKQPMRAGDSLFAKSPGGGGFGDPLTRPVDEVQRDLDLGYISRATAEASYGVVIADAPGGHGRDIDAAATVVRRDATRERSTPAPAGSGRV